MGAVQRQWGMGSLYDYAKASPGLSDSQVFAQCGAKPEDLALLIESELGARRCSPGRWFAQQIVDDKTGKIAEAARREFPQVSDARLRAFIAGPVPFTGSADQCATALDDADRKTVREMR